MPAKSRTCRLRKFPPNNRLSKEQRLKGTTDDYAYGGGEVTVPKLPVKSHHHYHNEINRY